MGNGEFDTTDANFTQLDMLKKELDAADRVNGRLIRLCCKLYKLAWEAGVDPDLPDMQAAEEQLKDHECWDDGPTEQSSAAPDE